MAIPSVKSGRQRLTALDLEILRHLLRHKLLRAHQAGAIAGAAGWTVKERMALLHRRGLIVPSSHEVVLRDPDGSLSRTMARAWAATPTAARLVGSWTPAGTTTPVALTSQTRWDTTVGAALGAGDLAAVWARAGYGVITHPEAVAADRIAAQAGTELAWTVLVGDELRVPLLGVVSPVDGAVWAQELALGTRTDWTGVVAAWRAAGYGVVIHALGEGNLRAVVDGCRAAGVEWGVTTVRGVAISTDGLTRVAGFRPGPSGLRGPASWRGIWPVGAPAGLPAYPCDLSRTWRGRRIPADVDVVLEDDRLVA